MFGLPNPCPYVVDTWYIDSWQMNSTDQIIMNQYEPLASSTTIMYNYTSACFKYEDMKMEPIFCAYRSTLFLYLKVNKLLAIFRLISGIAFLVVFFIYGTLPHLRNLHSKVVMCHAFNSAVSSFIQAIYVFHLLGLVLDNLSSKIFGMFIRIKYNYI